MINLTGTVVSAMIENKEIYFFVANKNDIIQRDHAMGKFYEAEELNIISKFFKKGDVFLDIGTNVGNHTIFICKYLYPGQVINIEPNPPAIEIFKINVALNGIERMVDLSHLGIGLADRCGKVLANTPQLNLGGARLRFTDLDDGIKVVRGDDIFSRRRVDFIKIDVEGMEMLVLSGMVETIAKWRPAIFIEIEDRNVRDFQNWVLTNNYFVADKFRRYKVNENYMIVPAEASVTEGFAEVV